MKIFIWLLTAVNLYFGSNAALNALGVLRSSKYSKGATIAYAIIFLGMGAFGAYTAWTSSNLKLGLWIALGPWLLMLVVMFFTLILSNPQ
jgi:hypothetical protein